MKKKQSTKCCDYIIIEKSYASLEVISDFIRERCTDVNFGFKRTWEIMLVVDGICSNIVLYSSPDEAAVLKVVFKYEGDAVCVSLYDEGQPYNPLVPREGNSEEDELDVIDSYTIESMIDEAYYKRNDGNNEIVLKKYRRRCRKTNNSD